jgi:type IV pilus assembly protein PilC
MALAKSKPASSAPATTTSAPAAKSSKRGKHVPGAGKIVAQQLPGFSRQFGAMLSAGMPMVSVLKALEEQTDNKNFKPVIADVYASIEAGTSLSEALRVYPTVFDNLYCNMVAGGEKSGELSETIARLSGFLESSAKLRRKVKSALMYPAVVLTMSIVISVALIMFVVPVFGEMFSDFGQNLPAPTQFLLDASAFLRGNWIVTFGAIGAGIFAFKKWKASEAGSYTWDKFMLNAPVFGKLNRLVVSARFARMLSQMMRSGVPIIGALKIVAGSTGNAVAGKIVENAALTVEKGEPLSSALVNQSVYPISMVRMLQAGEKTGSVNEMMDSVANYYEDEVDNMVSGLTSLLEPLLMAFMGALIGGLVVAMFLPIFKMGEVVGGG